MTAINERVNKLRDYIKANKAQNYPITGHPLENVTDYIKNIYLKMLCVITAYGDEVKEEQTLLLQRIISGVYTEGTIEDYMRQALDVEVSDFEEFLMQIKDVRLEYIFAVDAMLVTFVSDSPGEHQSELLAEILEMLCITKPELQYLVAISRSIIEQSNDVYSQAERMRPETVDYREFLCYCRKYITGIVCNSEKQLYLSSVKQYSFDLNSLKLSAQNEQYIVFKQAQVVMENLIIDNSCQALHFEANESVKFINCEFCGDIKSILFTACKNIEIINCIFRNFTSRTILLDNSLNIKIEGCNFINCKFNYHRSSNDWEALGGVIHSNITDNTINLVINSCEFKECGGVNDTNFYSSAVIANCSAQVSNSKFINCWNYYSNNSIDPDNYSRTLFVLGTPNINNEIIKSAKFS